MDTLEECLKLSCRKRGHRRLSARSTSAAASTNIPARSASIAIARTRADVLCDLDHFPYPFRDSSFASLRAVHVIEHVSDVIRAMEEFHRVVGPGGRVLIVTPHYTDFSSFCDPTHRWHLNSFSFRYFGAGSRRLRLLHRGALSRGFGPRPAAGAVALARLRVSGESFPALPPVLGVLSLLRRPRQGDGVRVRSDQVSDVYSDV